MKTIKIVLNLVLALAMFIFSSVITLDKPEAGAILLGLSVFLVVYTFAANINLTSEDPFRPQPLPKDLVYKKEVVVKHEHYNYNFKECVEGKEISRTLPNGTTVSVKHVRKWQ